MDQQYHTFRDTLQQEIDQIEKAYMTERTELIEKNINEINELYDIRRQKEESVYYYYYLLIIIIIIIFY